KMYINVPSSLPCVTIESSSSRVRFSRFPYSAAQQPVQCILHADVGSRRIAHGILQPSRSFIASCRALPDKLAFTIKFLKKAFRTPSFRSQTLIINSYQLVLSAIALRNAF